MSKMNRRDFLKLLGTTGAGIVGATLIKTETPEIETLPAPPVEETLKERFDIVETTEDQAIDFDPWLYIYGTDSARREEYLLHKVNVVDMHEFKDEMNMTMNVQTKLPQDYNVTITHIELHIVGMNAKLRSEYIGQVVDGIAQTVTFIWPIIFS